MQMNQYQTMANYMPQYQQYQPYNMLQRYQQPDIQQMQSGICGKVVQSQDMIVANDVPMNGSVAFFPKQDLSEIYAKQWGADGKISTMVFKPIQNDNPNKLSKDTEKLKIGLSDEVTEVFMKRFDELEKRIDDLVPKKTVARVKRESEEE